MPHIVIKMLEGRSPADKKRAAEAVKNAITESLAPEKWVTVSIEEYSAVEWQEVFKKEIDEKPGSLYVAPKYKPEELL